MSRRNGSEVKEDAPKVKLTKESYSNVLKIFTFIRPYRWKLILGIILLFISSMVFMLFPYLAGQMVDIAQGKSDFDWTLEHVAWILISVLAAQGLVSYFRVTLFASVSERGIADVRKALYDKLIALPIVFFENNRVGELISRLTSDVEKLYNAISIVIAEFLRQVIILIVGIVLLGITTPRLALIMLATFPIIVIGAIFFGRHIRKLSRERQKELAETNIILSETTQAINAVKAFTNEAFEIARYNRSIGSMVVVALKFARGRAAFSVFIVSILFGALFFIVWQAALMVQQGTLTAGALIAFVAYTAILGGAIAGLGNFYTQLLGAIGATERVVELLEMDKEVETTGKKSKDFRKLDGKIVFQDVDFSYPTRDDVPVLKKINFAIGAGQKVALVGASGAGKSTIVQLLMRFYDLDSGKIMVDDKNVNDYNITDFRHNIAIVPQEILLFGGTIRENILYGKPDANEAEVIEAAQKSNSWEFIQSFPEGLETIVGERGVKLSGGQRQRIAIARAILRNPSILLLDEATSSLDAESEKLVQDALNILMEGRTSIIIAHRLATIRDVDCIYVLDNGQIIEQGTHEVLSAIDDGAYSSLAKLQFESVK